MPSRRWYAAGHAPAPWDRRQSASVGDVMHTLKRTRYGCTCICTVLAWLIPRARSRRARLLSIAPRREPACRPAAADRYEAIAAMDGQWFFAGTWVPSKIE